MPEYLTVRSGVLTYKTYHHFNKILEFHGIMIKLLLFIISPLNDVQQQEIHHSLKCWCVNSTDFSQRYHKILTIKLWK